jgi:hypothetical protein
MTNSLLNNPDIPSNLPEDAVKALQTAQNLIADREKALIENPESLSKKVIVDEDGKERRIRHPHLAFLERLKRDGGDKVRVAHLGT